MSQRNKPERRTFIQDRFDILIKRQQNGKATFAELTELDEIVNRDPELREKVFRESILMDTPNEDSGPITPPQNDIDLNVKPVETQNWLTRLKEFLTGLFINKISVSKSKLSPVYIRQAICL